MSPKEAYDQARDLAKSGKYEQALQALIGHEHPKIAELRRQIESAQSQGKQLNKASQKKGVDFVGLLIALVIFLVAAGAGIFAASALDTPVYDSSLSPVAGIGIFFLLMIAGIALQRRLRT